MQLYLGWRYHLDRVDGRDIGSNGRARQLTDAIKVEFHGGTVEGRAVVELHALAQLQH